MESTLSIYRKGLCTFFWFLNSPRKIFYVNRSVATISDQREYLIKIILRIFCVIASIKLLVEKTISSLFFVHWPKTHISTMDNTTPSTSQNNMGDPPTTLQPTTKSPGVLTGPTNVDMTSSGMLNLPHFLTNFTISPINSHSFVTVLLFVTEKRPSQRGK